jgi:hypothetical protein
MTRVLNHLRSNVVAYLALFVALGGTSYAAIGLPAGSVGNRQLKNHSISPIKFDRGSIAGYVRDWAEIDPSGQLVASRPDAHLVGWGEIGAYPGGIVNWGTAIPKACIATASTDAAPPVASAGVTIIPGPQPGPYVGAKVLLSAPTEVTVAVICPQP